MRDIWCVVFDNEYELFLLKKQIESLALYNNLEYNLVLNEIDVEPLFKKLKSSGIISMLENANFKHNIISLEEIIDLKIARNIKPYRLQQIIKLQAYKKSNCNEHIILDSKNIIFKKDALKNFQPMHESDREIEFNACYKYCIARWNNFNNIKIRRPLTPYLFKSEILRMLEKDFGTYDEYIKVLSGSFMTCKNSTNILSEFTMYNVFEKCVDKNYKDKFDNPVMPKFITTSTNKSKISNFHSVLSIHRNVVKDIGMIKSNEIINDFLYGNKLDK